MSAGNSEHTNGRVADESKLLADESKLLAADEPADGDAAPSRDDVRATMDRLARKHARSLKILEAYDKGEAPRPRVRNTAEA